MQPPDSLITLINEGIIDEVVRPLMSGKEALVYLVRARDGLRAQQLKAVMAERGLAVHSWRSIDIECRRQALPNGHTSV